MDEVPPRQVQELGAGAAARIARTTAQISVACIVGIAVGLLLALVSRLAGLIVAGIGLVLLGIYLVATWRARLARDGILNGPWHKVFVVGWCRPPDGCNYAVFDASTNDRTIPQYVVRLPLRRAMKDGSAWLGGIPTQGLLRSVALVAESGELLGTGRILGRKIARTRWERRAQPPSKLVARPPEDRLPPGGS